MKRLLLGLAALALGQPLLAQPRASVSDVPSAPQEAAVPVDLDSVEEEPGPPNFPALWGGVDYLLWWIKDQPVPTPLVTTGNPLDPIPGALGQEGTRVLFGGNNIGYGAFSGLRATLGGWLDPAGQIGLEGSAFLLEQRVSNFAVASNASGSPPLYLPIIRQDPLMPPLGVPGSVTIADPLFPAGGPTSGAVVVATTTRLWGAEANTLLNLGRADNWSVAGLVGFRYLDLQEGLRLQGDSNEQGLDLQQSFYDAFDTRNQFYGGQLGARLGLNSGIWSLSLTGKAALGSTHQVVTTQGQSFYSGTGFALPPGVYPGGIYAQPSNIGRRDADNFSVVPQVQCLLGLDLAWWLRLTVGYDFLYWTGVVRPGNQINPNLNPNQFPGVPFVGALQPRLSSVARTSSRRGSASVCSSGIERAVKTIPPSDPIPAVPPAACGLGPTHNHLPEVASFSFSPLPCTRGRGVGGEGAAPCWGLPQPPHPQPLSPEYRGEGRKTTGPISGACLCVGP